MDNLFKLLLDKDIINRQQIGKERKRRMGMLGFKLAREPTQDTPPTYLLFL